MSLLSRVSAGIAVLLCIILWSNAAPAWDIKQMNTQIDQTNFVVNDGCSGTLISLKDRYVLTANHCVADQYETVDREKISAEGVITNEKVRRLKDGTVTQLSFIGTDSVSSVTYKVKVVGVDANSDLALLQVIGDLPNLMAAQLACVDPVRGDQAYIVGNPAGKLYSSVVVGIVSSMQRNYGMIGFQRDGASSDKESLMQISGGVIGGNSGGAAYNANGELIGVPVLGHRANEIIGFAVPLPSIRAFLKENGAGAIAAPAHCDAK